MFWQELGVVTLGGGIGALLRFLVAGAIERFWETALPLGVVVCNVLGCFCIGLIAGYFLYRHASGVLWEFFLVPGVLGGFTTFSSFSLLTLHLSRQGHFGLAFLNVAVSLVLCLAATGLGLFIAE